MNAPARPLHPAAFLAATIALLVPAFAAHAEGFVAASVGRTDSRDLECGNAFQCERKDTGGTVRGGYQYTPWFGVEGRYFDLGKARTAGIAGTVTFPEPGGEVTGHADYSAKGLGIDVVLSWPVTDRISISGTVGVARTEAKSSFTYDSPPGSGLVVIGLDVTHRGTNPYYGLGISFGLTPQLALSLEAERYRIDFGGSSTASIDMLGGGLIYRFR